MTTLATLLVAFGVDAKDFKSGLEDAERAAERSGGNITNKLATIGGGVLAGGIAAVGAGLAGMGLFLKGASDEAMEAQDNLAQLEAVLKSTGETASIAYGGLSDEAKKNLDKYTSDVEKSENSLLKLRESYAEKTASIQQTLSSRITEIAQSASDQLQSLEERHAGRIDSLSAQIAGTREDYEYAKAERAEDTERTITRMTEDYNHNRKKLVEDLASAETDAQKAAIQARLDDMDYEYNTRKKRIEEDATEREKDAEHEKDVRVKALQDQLQSEYDEYSKQTQRILSERNKREADARASAGRELSAVKEKYDKETAELDKFLAITQQKIDMLVKGSEPKILQIVRPVREQILSLADSFSQVTRFSDDTVLSGENLLLTFTSIGKDIFPLATQTMLDMSQALGQDTSSSAIQLGKALQDPITGVSALQRVGVNFTDAQKSQIKTMVESGDLMGAQNMILQELQKEFGGSAVAAGQTFGGQLDILNNRIANVKEGIGMALLPNLQNLLNTGIMPMLPNLEKMGNLFAVALGGGDTAQQIASLPENLQGIGKGISWVGERANEFLTTGLPGLMQKMSEWATWLSENKPIIVGVLAALGVAVAAFVFGVAVPAGIAFISAWWPVFLVMALVGVAAYILYRAWTENWGGIREKTQAVIDWLNTNVVPILKDVQARISQFIANVKAWWAEHGDDIIAKARYAWDWVKNKVDSALEFIKLLLKPFKDAWNGDWYAVGEDLRAIIDQWTLWKAEFWSGLWDKVKETFTTLKDKLIEKVKTTDWAQVGKDILSGIIVGLIENALNLIKASENIANAVVEVFKGFFGIKSPSTLMADEIGAPMAEGLMAGFRDSMGDFGMPAISKVSSMQPTFVSVNYAPMISTASELEATEALRPMFQRLARE